MRYWAGAILFAFGVWLIVASFAWRSKVRKDWHSKGILSAITGGAEPELTSLAVFGEITRPIILGVIAILAVLISFIYFMIDGGENFAYLDLAGLLFLLAGFGTWVAEKTRYSLVRYKDPAQAPSAVLVADDALVVPALLPTQHDPNVALPG